ncbi:MAG: P1 family peptidase [Chloroflexota bacterium]|nr:P1 family peptidase [Chloroflexota bacterium]
MSPVSQPPAPRPRARDLGVRIGLLPPGPTNSIVDVSDVAVGHSTLWRNEPRPPGGRGTARTGVTAIVPFEPATLFASRVPAGAAVLNGAGEAIGLTTIQEWGVIESPILLTSSMAIGRVYDGAIALLVPRIRGAGIDDALMPVVAECDDGDLNDSRTVQVDPADVARAIDGAQGAAAGRPGLGVVGAGTGLVSFELKGGLGSASRLVRPVDRRGDETGSDGHPYTVGALAMTNFGWLERLTVDGVPVGSVLAADGWPAAGGGTLDEDRPVVQRERGSCVVVLATDAPLLPQQLARLARRAGLGLARTGSTAGHGSGEIFIAISTGYRVPRDPVGILMTTTHLHDAFLDRFFMAAVEATEEAVIDSLFVADTVAGRDGNVVPGLPVERTLELLRAAGRLT